MSRPASVTGVQPMPRVHATVVHMLAEAAAQAPAGIAVRCDGESLRYDALLRAAAGFARHLAARGIGRGDRVAVLLGNGIEIAVTLYGVHALGAQAVPVNPAYTARELGEILADAAPHCLVAGSAQAEFAAALAAQAGAGTPVLWNEELVAARRRWAGDATLTLPVPLPDPGWPATLMYTGGTTGRAKGVDIAHGPMALNVSQREALLPTQAGDERILCVMPMFHSFAMLMCLYSACYARGTLVILPRYHPELVTTALVRERITFFPASPTMLTGLLGYEPFLATRLTDLRLTLSGSAALPVEILNRWQAQTGCRVLEGYGLTEAGPMLSYNPRDGVSKPGSVGLPAPGITLEIVDPDSGARVLVRGEQGEVRARGAQLMTGYRNLPEQTAETLRGGWLYTGDIGELDEDGYLFIRDRKKDMAIVGGYNVYPREIDEVLYSHPEVAEVGAVGVPDAYRGEIVKAYVVPRPGCSPGEEALLAHCRANLAGYKVPARIEFVSALPRTQVGKLDRKALRALATAGVGAA